MRDYIAIITEHICLCKVPIKTILLWHIVDIETQYVAIKNEVNSIDEQNQTHKSLVTSHKRFAIKKSDESTYAGR